MRWVEAERNWRSVFDAHCAASRVEDNAIKVSAYDRTPDGYGAAEREAHVRELWFHEGVDASLDFSDGWVCESFRKCGGPGRGDGINRKPCMKKCFASALKHSIGVGDLLSPIGDI